MTTYSVSAEKSPKIGCGNVVASLECSKIAYECIAVPLRNQFCVHTPQVGSLLSLVVCMDCFRSGEFLLFHQGEASPCKTSFQVYIPYVQVTILICPIPKYEVYTTVLLGRDGHVKVQEQGNDENTQEG